MKRLTAILALLLLAATAVSAKKDSYRYEALYANLPFEMPRVERPAFPDRKTDLSKYARSGAREKCTADFQRAIDELAAQGGGTLVVPAGLWYTGPIVLKSRINLHLDKGAVILFSKDLTDYPMVETNYEGARTRRAQSPVSARNAVDVAITGQGVIDGNGEYWRPLKRDKVTANIWKRITSRGGVFKRDNLWQPAEEELPRPTMVDLYGCRNVLLEGVIFQNSPAWNLHPECCENVIIDGVDVRNPSYAQNGDGLDLESCKNCIVVNTTFDVGDDGICIKSGKNEFGIRRGIPTENVIISGCTVYAGHGGFVIGSEMSGGVRNIKCSDCTFLGTDNGLRFKSCRGRGGVVENIWIEDVTMTGILGDAIRFNLYYGGKRTFETLPDGTKHPAAIPAEPVGITTPSFRSIRIKNLTCKDANNALYFNGLPEMPVKDITLENVEITARSAGEMIYCEGVEMKNTVIEARDGKPVRQYFCTDIR